MEFCQIPLSNSKLEDISMGSQSCDGRKESLNGKALQILDDDSDSDSYDPLPLTYIGTSLMATMDFQEDEIYGIANQETANTNHDNNINDNAYRNNLYGEAVQITAEIDTIGTFPYEEEKKTWAAAQKLLPSRPQMSRHRSQLKTWPDLWRTDETKKMEMSSTLNKIRDSIDQLSKECSDAEPNVLCTNMEVSQTRPRTSLRKLSGSKHIEDCKSVFTQPSELNSRIPEWRRRGQNFVPASKNDNMQNGFGANQTTLTAGASPEMGSDYALGPRQTSTQSREKTTLGSTERPFNRLRNSPLPSRANDSYAPYQTHTFTRSRSTTAKNEDTNSRTPRRVLDTPDTASNCASNGLSPFSPNFKTNVTQAPSTIITPNDDDPMHRRHGLLFPSPNYPSPPTSSPKRTSNKLYSAPSRLSPRTEYLITGYKRTDPTVLWADAMPPVIAPPHLRHAASTLPENGFLSSPLPLLSTNTSAGIDSSSSPPSTSAVAAVSAAVVVDSSTIRKPHDPSITIVDAATTPTLPASLRLYLEERNERLRKHAEGDVWRAKYAKEVVRRYEETVFGRRAREGDRVAMAWHMSAEYHGVCRSGKGNGGGGGSGGGSGSGNGRGEVKRQRGENGNGRAGGNGTEGFRGRGMGKGMGG